ncbi:F-box/LRR-repeat protein 8 isoform X1 [Salvelinus alpinus]|uniref:F-box/LRR-repeat protein 8 isoform X1 n=1 Tax=Salvelinus alpinus TaxID=8036 RepID=UPI0039FC89D8
MEFPEEVLAHIFSYLSVKERDSASAVCRRWSQSMSHPRVWRYTEIRCETGEQEDPALQHFSSLLPLVRHLKITVSSLSDPANRSAALSVLRLATSGPLRTLTLSCSGGVPLFYSGHDLEEGLEAALTAAPEHVGGAFLSHLDLRGVPFTLSQSLVRALARQSPNLRSLLVNNQTLVCKVEPEAVVEVLGLCPLLNTLGLFYTSLSQKVVDELLLPQRCPLLAMELYCERFAKYIPPLEDSVWAGLKHRHPGLKETGKFYSCTIESILTGCITAWYGNCLASDRKALQRVVRTAQYITGAKLPAIQDLYTRRCQRKAQKIVRDSSHPSHRLFSLLPHGKRYWSAKSTTRCLLSMHSHFTPYLHMTLTNLYLHKLTRYRYTLYIASLL